MQSRPRRPPTHKGRHPSHCACDLPLTPGRRYPLIPPKVWWPDSADKTAQAMEEFDREGLPLFILANWRGFAGGQRDLFEGVLQVGCGGRVPLGGGGWVLALSDC
jgi:hypothetical protein